MFEPPFDKMAEQLEARFHLEFVRFYSGLRGMDWLFGFSTLYHGYLKSSHGNRQGWYNIPQSIAEEQSTIRRAKLVDNHAWT
jgi:hypothetical protein